MYLLTNQPFTPELLAPTRFRHTPKSEPLFQVKSVFTDSPNPKQGFGTERESYLSLSL